MYAGIGWRAADTESSGMRAGAFDDTFFAATADSYSGGIGSTASTAVRSGSGGTQWDWAVSVFGSY